MSLCYFIYNNLKINPFVNGDGPLPGFSMISWDAYTYTEGTLWELDIGDAGYTKIGIDKVHGQLWKVEDTTQIHILKDCFGANKGLTYETDVEVTIEFDKLDKSNLKAKTFALEKISPKYEIIKNGRWKF